jgi:Mycothiol maleylpyruvate isomerase N-terminal domain
LSGAEVVIAAVSDPRVAGSWDQASVLAEQTIGSLASHLARGGVWVVGEYLDAGPPRTGADFSSAAHFFGDVSDTLTDEDHAAIRARAASMSAHGPGAVVERLIESVTALRERLPREPADRLLSVYQGKVMRLDDYLLTRIVEQVVHLDDLARSLGILPWPNPPGAEALVVACGAEIGRQRRGGTAMLRALFRSAPAGVLPVL